MGMFDELLWESELPMPDDLGEHKDHDFSSKLWQTKSLGSSMDKYRVDEEGRFWKEHEEGYYNNRPGTQKWWAEDDYFGVIIFYTFLQGKKEDLFLEYKCKVDDGKLRNVVLSEGTWLQSVSESQASK